MARYGSSGADIPIELSTTFEHHRRPPTSKALGLTIPQSTLLRETEVVE
jgi:hypothetical protein